MKLYIRKKSAVEGAVTVKKGDDYVYPVLIFSYDENIPYPDYFKNMKLLGEFKWSYRLKDGYVCTKPGLMDYLKSLKLAPDELIDILCKEEDE